MERFKKEKKKNSSTVYYANSRALYPSLLKRDDTLVKIKKYFNEYLLPFKKITNPIIFFTSERVEPATRVKFDLNGV
jgi:hypothetical protein